ncbi:hypothetical protein KC19_1G099600 [Ceratodon purpureus]|uniref:Uncharacterized protein n=1 Tax=Ceratodon purpureus TaxID=3225 RepID=A0A8T0J4G5_CERPU|nr:hypothetical protein KC19_1G099600 [Ceratodon purpureus]
MHRSSANTKQRLTLSAEIFTFRMTTSISCSYQYLKQVRGLPIPLHIPMLLHVPMLLHIPTSLYIFKSNRENPQSRLVKESAPPLAISPESARKDCVRSTISVEDLLHNSSFMSSMTQHDHI